MSSRDGSARLRLFSALRRARWRVEMGRGSGHYKIWNPHGRLITTTPGSASDTNSLKALLRDLSKAGFQHNRRDRQPKTSKIPNQRSHT